jgi:non-canonical purine NTP pyrophosphatase (RdgB/HAM1 family)
MDDTKISFITGNDNKFAEAIHLVENLVRLDIDLPEIQELDPHKIIAYKLDQARLQFGGTFVVEDTSLCLDGMNGFPGPLIKWWLQAQTLEEIYDIVASTGNFSATARTLVGYSSKKGEVIFFEGEVRGTIVRPEGPYSFGWEKLFKPDSSTISYGFMDRTEKQKHSMRAKAFRKLKHYLYSN